MNFAHCFIQRQAIIKFKYKSDCKIQMQVKNANTKKAIETLDQETYRECQMRGRTYK